MQGQSKQKEPVEASATESQGEKLNKYFLWAHFVIPVLLGLLLFYVYHRGAGR